MRVKEKEAPPKRQVTGFDWYVQTEMANHILNSLIVRYGSAIVKEKEKPHPDSLLISEYSGKSDALQAILHRRDSFDTIENMTALIEEYGPILKEMNE